MQECTQEKLRKKTNSPSFPLTFHPYPFPFLYLSCFLSLPFTKSRGFVTSPSRVSGAALVEIKFGAF